MSTKRLSARLARVQTNIMGGTTQDVMEACQLIAAYMHVKCSPETATDDDRALLAATPWSDIQDAMGTAQKACSARGEGLAFDDVVAFAFRVRAEQQSPTTIPA